MLVSESLSFFLLCDGHDDFGGVLKRGGSISFCGFFFFWVMWSKAFVGFAVLFTWILFYFVFLEFGLVLHVGISDLFVFL